MTANFFKIAFRNFKKQKSLFIINLLLLTVALASCLVLGLYIAGELSYDRHNTDVDRTYRLIMKGNKSGKKNTQMPAAMYGKIEPVVPEAEEIVRIRPINIGEVLLSNDSIRSNEKNFIFAEKKFFKVFTREFLSGDPETALLKPYSVVITESMAKKYYGNSNPVGKFLRFDNQMNLTVTGVISDLKTNAHFTFDFCCSLETVEAMNPGELASWQNYSNFFYIKLAKNSDPVAAAEKITKNVAIDPAQGTFKNVSFILQPLSETHLYSSDINNDIAEFHGSIQQIYGFAGIGLLILVMACFNFINLSTAQINRRALDTGIRKVMGAQRFTLMMQFLAETLIIVVFSTILSLALLEIVRPAFNILSGTNLNTSLLFSFGGISIILALIFFITLVVGGYPALVLSSYKPSEVIKGVEVKIRKINMGFFSVKFRHLLVLFQFVIAVSLIVVSYFIFKQLDYIEKRDQGYNPSSFLTITNPWDGKAQQRIDKLKLILANDSRIEVVTMGHNVPPCIPNNYSATSIADDTTDQAISTIMVSVAKGYFDGIGAKLIAGRDFSDEYGTDDEATAIISKRAAELLGNDIIGKKIDGFYFGPSRRVIGIVDDIFFESIHDPIKPTIYFIESETYPPNWINIIVKYKPGVNTNELVADLQKTWDEISPEWPFQYQFPMAEYMSQYGP
jgi:putative ABC transport system permease protein